AEVFAVEAAPVSRADVGLRAGDGELLHVVNPAADLHAAVALAALEPDLERQLEVAVLLLAAQERIEVDALAGVADDGAVVHLPVFHQALEAVGVLAVEELAGLAV